MWTCWIAMLMVAPSAVPSVPAAANTLSQGKAAMPRDVHSYANPDQVRVRHLDLDLEVRFGDQTLAGTATLQVESTSAERSPPLILDTLNLTIVKCEASAEGTAWAPVPHRLGATTPILGTPLTIALPAGTTQVRIVYRTHPKARALQWLAPAQTAGKRHPFLFTQSQAINARSWIPLQDSPGVRMTYSATIRTPKELRAIMSAVNDPKAPLTGVYRFSMPHPIPSYLIALAVGDIAFAPISDRTGVYAEPNTLRLAAAEFADLESMMQATESLYGPYRWGRYDVLVLPPSFPMGGMENPCLTFATPTILAGDKSLVSLIAHELAHSWSGNLVTNATWNDFWLNEGFTVYLERRIVEKIYGQARAEREAVLGRQDLERELPKIPVRERVLKMDLAGQDPDDAVTAVPYEKGALFLTHLEQAAGRERFDAFLKAYFEHFAFQSITTEQFRDYLNEHLLAAEPKIAQQVPIDAWLHDPVVPASAPAPSSDSFARVEVLAKEWLAGTRDLKTIAAENWSTHEWLHFLRFLPATITAEQMAALDQAFGLTASNNAEIAHQWLLVAIRQNYAPANPRLEQYLTTIGRRKLVKPLYEALAKTPENKQRALEIYAKARPLYHAITSQTIDQILGWKEADPTAGSSK